jgi:hypothetical protein
MTITAITKVFAGGVSAVAIGASMACDAGDQGALSQAALAAGAPAQGTPVVVSCEPNQRTLVRPVVVNGATLSQIECISAATAPFATAAPLYAPAPVEAVRPARVVQQVSALSDGLADARVVPVSQPVTVARPITTEQVVYREPRRQTRSVKKSAIIIGSSAGAGAGVGAAVGGKKGALIGAAIGGGGAALWDQITRRDR